MLLTIQTIIITIGFLCKDQLGDHMCVLYNIETRSEYKMFILGGRCVELEI